MPEVKYKQLLDKPDLDNDIDVFSSKTRKGPENCIQKTFLSLGLILLYFSLSIGLTFYQRWLLKDFHYPLTVVAYHLVIKWLLSVVIRTVLYLVTRTPPLVLPFGVCFRAVCPTGVASGIDVGFSNWGLELVTISLYTMTKSTTIIFILGFAIIMGLEKKSSSLIVIVFMIACGLIMFTYKATQFNLLGFNFLLIASFAAGLRWTFAQLLMQKLKLGLHNPIDMVFHVQPWMLMSLLPFMLWFEGVQCFQDLAQLPADLLMPAILKISVGATVAFAMEISEFLVVTYTSSLTLSIAGIFKEMCILVLAVEVSGDQLSTINVLGLSMCLLGIMGHIVHKIYVIRSVTSALNTSDTEEFSTKLYNRVTKERQNEERLLDEQDANSQASDSDVNSNVLFEVINRRDAR